MTVLLKNLYTGHITTSTTPLYTAPDTASARIMGATLWNASTDQEQYSFWRVTGGSPSDANVLAENHLIAASDNLTVDVLSELVLEPGQALYAKASSDSVLTLALSGIEQTVS
jgi:hypothetical protein